MTTVAVLGLGAMGLPMARHLAGTCTIRGYDPAAERRTPLEEFGTACASAREAATGADIALLAVRDHAQLRDALWGDDGVAQVLAAGSVVLMTSTVGIDAVRAEAPELAGHELLLVDAPVSGGPVRAGNGDLLVTVGAEPAAYEKARPVLEAMASTLTWVGEHPGDGQSMKTVNQLLCGVHIAAAAEALALAGELGLDREQALATLQAGAAASFMLGDRGPRMLQDPDDVEVRSRLEIFVKDMGLVGAAARQAGLATPVAAAAGQLFLLGQAQGLATADDSSVISVLRPLSPDGPA